MIRFRQAAIWVAALAVMAGGITAAAAGGVDSARKQPHKPFRIYGNTFYVGSAGYASILISSDYGFVLVDTGPKEIAPQVIANIQELGFKLSDLKAIVVSDARAEHAGGINELQKVSGAQVYTARPGEEKLRSEKPPKDDKREGAYMGAIPPIPQIWVVQDDQLLGIASVRLRALATPGGAPEGASWSWDACDGSKCLATVYAASMEPESGGKPRADARNTIESSLAKLEGAPCELLLTPRPDDAAGGLDRLVKADGKQDVVKSEAACKAYTQQVRATLAK